MSEGILYGRGAYARREEKRAGLGRMLVIFNILLGLTIVGELVFHFALAPMMTLRRVYVESEVPMTNEEVLRIAGISRKEYYFSLDDALIRKNLESSPLVRKAYIEKIFPDALKVVLYGRKPLALSFVEIDGGAVPVLVDEEGVVFRAGTAAAGQSLPVLSGLVPEELQVGSRLSPQYLPILKELKALKEKSPDLFGLISELRLERKNDRRLEALLYPVNHRVPVRIGEEIDARLCTYIMMVLDVMEQEHVAGNLEELDFRTGEVVYRTREE